MWPQALQMTRDECRGILRRLELESYSQVISVFRAQGGLSDAKAKLLEELRGIFHISNERHRAEARRVANDEQLATIAEAISGPNTWQEWSREGRRPYPLLPRVAPQTALALIANSVADQAAQENDKLAYPSETGVVIKEEQLIMELQQKGGPLETDERKNYVIMEEPFKVPDIPAAGGKKTLKRNIIHDQNSSSLHTTSGGSVAKKRIVKDTKHYPHITANSPQANALSSTVSGQLNDRGKHQQQQYQQQNATSPYLQKQRYFHHQQQVAKQKMAKKLAAAANNAGNTHATKRQATPAKSGRRAQKMLMEQQQQHARKQHVQQQLEQQQQNYQMQHEMDIDPHTHNTTVVIGSHQLTQQQLDMQFVSYANQAQPQPPQQIFMDTKDFVDHQSLPQHPSSSNLIAGINSSSSALSPSSFISSNHNNPQAAASKRDIAKNYTKLHMHNTNVVTVGSPIILPAGHEIQTSNFHSILPPVAAKTLEKSLISTTPVQKYIVEDRQSSLMMGSGGVGGGGGGGGGGAPQPGSIVNIQSSCQSASGTGATSHIIQVSNAAGGGQTHIMTLPQFSAAAASKLRAVNTTIIGPGAGKISGSQAKKLHSSAASTLAANQLNAGALHELANVASTQSQVLQPDSAAAGSSSSSAAAAATQSSNNNSATPLHTPPAIIQLHNSPSSQAHMDSATTVPQNKVITSSKILPIVLQGAVANQAMTSFGGNTNNTVVLSSAATLSISTASTTNTTNTSSGSNSSSSTTTTPATIIKQLPSTVVLNTASNFSSPINVTGSCSSTGSTIISTLGAGAMVFRKPPNIIKTSTTAASSMPSATKSNTPQIISNVKLTPVNVSSASGTSSFKNVTSSATSAAGMLRTSVKICQSPNGKMFIQPAGSLLDATKLKLNATANVMSHKLLQATNVVSSASATGVLHTTCSYTNNSASVVGGVGGGGQRIAIQKVQIIPAPMSSPAPGLTAASNSHTATTKTSTTTSSVKSNMIFMPTSANTNVRPVTLSKISNNLLLKSTQAAAAAAAAAASSASTEGKQQQQHQQPTTNTVLIQLSATQSHPNHAQTLTFKDKTISAIKIDNPQLHITAEDEEEDDNTPLDILNMPIVMDTGSGAVDVGEMDGLNIMSAGSSSAETLTVLGGNILETQATTGATPIIVEHNPSQQQQQQHTLILDATDWEMELDQAITTANNAAAATSTTATNSNIKAAAGGTMTTTRKRTISSMSSLNSAARSSLSSSSPTTLAKKRSNNAKNNVIATPTSSTTNLIYVDDSFDENIIVEDDHVEEVEEHHHDEDNDEEVTKNIFHTISATPTTANVTTSSNQMTTTIKTNPINTPSSLLYIQQPQKSTDILYVESSKEKKSFQISDTQITHTNNNDDENDIVEERNNIQQHKSVAKSRKHDDVVIDAKSFDETFEIDENTAIEYIAEEGGCGATAKNYDIHLATTTTTTTNTTSTSASASSLMATEAETYKEDLDEKAVKNIDYNHEHVEFSSMEDVGAHEENTANLSNIATLNNEMEQEEVQKHKQMQQQTELIANSGNSSSTSSSSGDNITKKKTTPQVEP